MYFAYVAEHCAFFGTNIFFGPIWSFFVFMSLTRTGPQTEFPLVHNQKTNYVELEIFDNKYTYMYDG